MAAGCRRERCDQAARYLAEPGLYLSQITGLLGYSEQSALTGRAGVGLGRRLDSTAPGYRCRRRRLTGDLRRQSGEVAGIDLAHGRKVGDIVGSIVTFRHGIRSHQLRHKHSQIT